MNQTDLIVALATPSGRGGVGVIRISGSNIESIAKTLLKKIPAPRHAQYQPFFDRNGDVLDEGIALYFKAPHSFTGEDVLELQGHGGPVILDCIIKEIIALGARIARPGEFSERAFLNNKMDLSQAEAIADLIHAASEQAARCAVRSLQGEFSNQINALVEKITSLRIFVEAAIDFPEEEIDFLSDQRIQTQLNDLLQQLENIQKTVKQGTILQEGITIVIAGKPNAGKSSLLNQFTGRESAIVTEIPGTTRDVLREYIHLDGIPLHIIDTAGLRDSDDHVEQEGIRRAWQEIKKADHLLLIVDSREHADLDFKNLWPSAIGPFPDEKPITVIRNKIDLTKEPAQCIQQDRYTTISLSAKTGDGLPLLIEHLKSCIGFHTQTEGQFIARRRHLDALNRATDFLKSGQQQLSLQKAGELLAEDLRLAQSALGEITGKVHSDQLLGKIFSSFCIGK